MLCDVPILRYISDLRLKQIHSHAEPYLEPGEEITDFARCRHPETRKKGFVYMTDERVLIAWKVEEGSISINLAKVVSWGVNHDHRGGPVLSIETPEESAWVQLLTSSRAMAEGAIRFLLLVAERVPKEAIVTLGEGEGSFDGEPDLEVRSETRSVGELTRRILVTVLGVTLILGAIVIIPLPGPWSFLITIAGLAILASEYDWAEDALDWFRLKYKRARDKIRARREARRQAQG
jgi:uncharacterized protein (TIGR02611 family)